MPKKTARQSDAASIIGEAIAADLEAKSQELIGRSGPSIDPAAIILKNAEGFPPSEEEAETEEMPPTGTVEEEAPPEEALPFGERAYGGATTLNGAEAFLIRQKGNDILLGDWDILAGVLTNISGPTHRREIAKELKEFQSRIDVMALKTLANLSKRQEATMAEELEDEGMATGTVEADVTKTIRRRRLAALRKRQETLTAEIEQEFEDQAMTTGTVEAEMPETEADVLKMRAMHEVEVALEKLGETFEQAIETPIDNGSRLKMIQPILNEVGEVIVEVINEIQPEGAETTSANGGITLEQLSQAVQAAVAPLHAQIAGLTQQSVAGQGSLLIPSPRAARLVSEGTRLSYAGAVPGETFRMANEAEAASALRGADWNKPPQINPFNDSVSNTQTPKLSALIRRSLGLRN